MSLNTTLEQDYIGYLKYKRYTERTIKNKLGHLKHYTDWLEQEHMDVIECSYSDIMGFVKKLQRDGGVLPVRICTLEQYVNCMKA